MTSAPDKQCKQERRVVVCWAGRGSQTLGPLRKHHSWKETIPFQLRFAVAVGPYFCDERDEPRRIGRFDKTSGGSWLMLQALAVRHRQQAAGGVVGTEALILVVPHLPDRKLLRWEVLFGRFRQVSDGARTVWRL